MIDAAAAASSARPDSRGQRGVWRRWIAVRTGLIWTLVRTDFKARYHGSASGFAWALLKPIAIFLVLFGVFSFLFTDPAYKLRLIIGLFLWDFFAEATRSGLLSLRAKSFLLTKARCPLWIVVITSSSNAVITLTVFGSALVTFLAVTHRVFTPAAPVLFALYGTALLLITTGFALASSVLFLRYRDLNQVWEVVTQAGFFLAPIVYPIGILPERFHFYLYLWPPTPVIEFARAVLVDGKLPTATAHMYLALEVVAALAAGAGVFRALAPTAAEYV